MNKKIKIFFIGAVTKEHGQGRVTSYSLNILKKEYDVLFLNTHIRHFSFLLKIINSIIILFKTIYILLLCVPSNSKKIIYFTPSRNFFSSFKDFLLLFMSLGIKILNKDLYIVGHLHGSDLADFLSKSIYGQLLYKLYKHNLDKMIINSENHKKIALGKKFKNYEIINNPIIISNALLTKINNKKTYKRGKINITFISVPTKEKGLYESISLIEKILEKEDWLLNVVGWSLDDYYRIYKSENKLNNKILKKINFLGRISDLKKNNILLKSNLFILLSYKEAQPLTVIEASIFKCGLILSEIDMLSEFKNFKSILYDNKQLNRLDILQVIKNKKELSNTSNQFIANHSYVTYRKNFLKALKVN